MEEPGEWKLRAIIKENHNKSIHQLVVNKSQRYRNLVATVGDTQVPFA
jgi:hypothetical protein